MGDNRDTFVSEIYVNNTQAQDATANLSKKLEEQTKKWERLRNELGDFDKKTLKAKKDMESTQKSLDGVKKGVENYAEAMKDLGGRSMENLLKLQRQLNAELKKTKPNTKEWDSLAESYRKVTARIKELDSVQKGVVVRQNGFMRQLNGVANSYMLIGKAVGVAIGVIRRFADAYKVISNFEQANANLASILGATSDQMEVLEKAAIQLGSSTRYSASQVTGLQTELAKLGFTVKEITDMSPAVLNFAGSVGTDLASAAALAGVALRSFNLRSDQTEDALGTMAVACNKSALSFQYLQNSFSTIAPVAKTYGLSLKDTIALLGTLANAGFDASSAATATRNILLNLSNTNGKLAKALGGSVHSFEDIMAAMKKLRGQGVDLNTTLELTDKRSVAAFNTFLDGAESAMELRGALENVNGELQLTAEQRANTVEGAIDGMKSAWEGLVLSFRSSTGTFASVFKFITGGINGIRELIDPEGTIEERTAKMYSEMFRNIGNEFISVEETRERVWAKYQELEKSIREGGGGVVYKKHALEGLKKAYNEVMPELTEMAKAANEKVLEINEKYKAQEDAIYNERAKLLEKNSKAVGTQAWKDLEERLAANKSAWEEELKQATAFKKKEAEILAGSDGDSGKTGGGGVDEKELAKRQQAYNKKKAQMEAYLNYEEKRLKVAWLKGEMGEADYNSAVYTAKAQYYQDLLELARQYGQDDTAIRNKMLDDHIKALEAEKKRIKEEMEGIERYNQQGAYTPSTGAANGIRDPKAYQDFQEKIWAKAAEIRAAIAEDSARTEYETEMKWAQKLAKQKKITAEEAEKYILQAKLKYAQNAADQVNQIAEMASNFVVALKDYETQQLEAQYQAQLTAAGDNAEKREQIDAEYEQKKLDLQKKYADVDMAINIAKTVANGAAGVVRALADPGGVAGYVLAALVGVTTAAEVATIVAQRNAIKNTSVSSGGGSSAVKTGQRTVTGYSGGGFTEQGSDDNKPVGIVHQNEWVAPAWMVRNDPVTFANLERYRKAGSHGRSGSMKRGFADGGYTNASYGQSAMAAQATLDVDWQAMRDFNEIMRYCAENGLFVKYGDILIAKEKLNNFKSQTSR